ncbi:hypothetical protein [Microbacterium sp. SLBN-146]|uniref:hypothetical protein n=1 Tax=Microbacterium sp. SLBN-146 TaxID=2768457 RepID=UPI0011505703|nr:hypothetical protein [Microbacterium sp. SLBN-146]
MSTVEPFMPAHEPASEPPPTARDIDHDTDVVFDRPIDGEAPLVIDHDAPPPPFHAPSPGDHLTAAELAEDLGD